MSLEQAILDRLEKRNGQIAQLQSTVHALERAADSQREHAMMERGRPLEENKRLAAQIESDENVSRLNREHAQYQIASLTAEVAKLRAEVPLESTREGLKNAVAKLQEVTTEKDRMRLQLENAHADLKQAVVERDSFGVMAADRALEIRKLMDGHAEDMKAQAELTAQLDSTKGEAEEWLKQCHAARRQRDEVREEARKETQRLSDLCAELQSKYESLLAKTTDLGSYAMTIGRKEGEPLEMFMERQALRLAALESQAGKIGYVANGEHEEAVTAARENGIHKGESLSGFIWRQCEGLRKSQAENAPLTKLFVVLCKQRGMRAYRCDRCGLYHLTKEGRQFDEQQRSYYDAGPEQIERERSAME